MNAHEILQMLFYTAVGVWALVFGRKTWSNPEKMHEKWLKVDSLDASGW